MHTTYQLAYTIFLLRKKKNIAYTIKTVYSNAFTQISIHVNIFGDG